jgi:glyoxylase-like metal-dependent hydrolase (beta-lactamase superfamily II)
MAGEMIGVDLAEVTADEAGKEYVTTLAWGEPVEVLERRAKRTRIGYRHVERTSDGSILPTREEGWVKAAEEVVGSSDDTGVLRVDFVDVQQGDGTVIETPKGDVVLIDGGENQLFARYLAARYRGTSAERPKELAAIVVSHGDADHFRGLAEMKDSETHEVERKRFFASPARVFHNGIVKRPGGGREVDELGPTKEVGDVTLLTGLVEDLAGLPESALNTPFRRWRKALEHYRERRGGDLTVKRLEIGDHAEFDFLDDEDIQVEVLGPVPETHDGVTGLRFLGTPKRKFGHHSQIPTTFTGRSASHTINGHSIVLRLTYRDWRFLFCGDLNEQSEQVLAGAHARGELSLQSDVLKVPHHGSADFLYAFLQAVEPVVSVVSAGDESARVEYIHPRATLLAALGRCGRGDEPVVFVTEMVAFFEAEGFVLNKPPKKEGWAERREPFFAFSRAAYGSVRIRTDGKRLLVYTDSGQADLKEAYAYTLGPEGKAVPQEVRRV